MKELFLPYKLAMIAKEKGFNNLCFAAYDNNKHFLWASEVAQVQFFKNSDTIEKCCTALLYQQVVDWFREKHNIEVSVKSWKNEGDGKVIYVYSNKILGLPSTFRFDFKSELYYETLNKAIEEAFNLI